MLPLILVNNARLDRTERRSDGASSRLWIASYTEKDFDGNGAMENWISREIGASSWRIG